MKITIEDKKGFIRWFLNHHKMKRREGNWMLAYFLNHESMLERVHFVRDARLYKRGIVISAHGCAGEPFCYYKDQEIIKDAEEGFHDVRLNRDDAYYIQLNFKNSIRNDKYAYILEEDESTSENPFKDEDEKVAEHFLMALVQQKQMEELKKEIDQALENRDQEQFLFLANRMKNLSC
ncbi:YpiB family protein (plasmid) [Pontibacillus sp. ALD_SL1]|uniref:ReoY family proteolytic degradation factor n=1 Tax=Pontibacillus sp. ALD_SL1 TaxID=2777185 RepID=UPI001A978827|nr:ReoY family proteolytic degradation factor [Pontibacillus sp. ALD_SL1]QST03103.1 YpiB family protein [Pontibacillus sp. ALD_SL1]